MGMLNNQEIPIGLSMALAENLPAMERFSNMSREEQKNFIERCHGVESKQEMKSLVSELNKTV